MQVNNAAVSGGKILNGDALLRKVGLLPLQLTIVFELDVGLMTCRPRRIYKRVEGPGHLQLLDPFSIHSSFMIP